MMNRAVISKYGTYTLLNVNFSELKTSKDFELVVLDVENICKQMRFSRHESVLVLADFTGAYLSPEIFDILIRYGLAIKELIYRHAIIRSNSYSIVKSILRSYTNKEVHSFSTAEDALNWLTAKRGSNTASKPRRIN